MSLARNNPFGGGGDPDYEPKPGSDHTDLHETFTRGVSWGKEQTINFGECLESLSHILVQGTIYHGLQTGRWSEAYDIS